MVVVYSKDNCPACNGVKNFLANNGIELEERNINDDEKFMEEVGKLGYSSVPVTLVDGKEIVGFDLPELQKVVKNNK